VLCDCSIVLSYTVEKKSDIFFLKEEKKSDIVQSVVLNKLWLENI